MSTKRRRELSPWQKIVRSAYYGTGLRLTADEVAELGGDDAVRRVAANECGQEGWEPKWMGEYEYASASPPPRPRTWTDPAA